MLAHTPTRISRWRRIGRRGLRAGSDDHTSEEKYGKGGIQFKFHGDFGFRFGCMFDLTLPVPKVTVDARWPTVDISVFIARTLSCALSPDI